MDVNKANKTELKGYYTHATQYTHLLTTIYLPSHDYDVCDVLVYGAAMHYIGGVENLSLRWYICSRNFLIQSGRSAGRVPHPLHNTASLLAGYTTQIPYLCALLSV